MKYRKVTIEGTFDEERIVSAWCVLGDSGGVEYDPPEDYGNFHVRCFAYKQQGGKLIFDQMKDDADELAKKQTSLGERRDCASLQSFGNRVGTLALKHGTV